MDLNDIQYRFMYRVSRCLNQHATVHDLERLYTPTSRVAAVSTGRALERQGLICIWRPWDGTENDRWQSLHFSPTKAGKAVIQDLWALVGILIRSRLDNQLNGMLVSDTNPNP